jgi:Concanavalin A-like lectin/glucanases superfamily/F5/8 type C domain
MKGFYYLAILCIPFTALGQIGLPIQQSIRPKSNLVVNYDFSKPASFTRGNSVATNIAASGNASVVNAPIFMNSLGFIELDGVNEYIMTPNLRPFFKSVNASAQKSFTMSLWIYPTALNGVIVSELDSQTPSSGFHATNIEIVNGFIKYRVWDSPIITSSLALNLNRWYHIAMVYNGTAVKAYLNGVLQGTQTAARDIPSIAQNYAIGASETTYMGSGGYGKFNLAQFKLYNLPLTDLEILQEYLARKDEFDYTIHSPSSNANPTYWSVSSAWNGETTFSQQHYTPWINNITLGWAAGANDANQSITLSYDAPTTIKGIVTQGRANNGGQWVTTAHIETSPNGVAPWTRVISNATLNSNSIDDARVLFPTPVFAKAVRILPVGWINHITMRLGLLLKPIDFTTNNLILYYNPAMTESYSGTGTTVNDISGNGMNGTLSNVTTSATAFTFNGSNSQVSIPDNAILEPGTGNWTIEVWFKPTVVSGTLLGKYNNGGNTANISYALRMGANYIRADFSNGSTGFTSDNYTLTPNNWVQMVYVWNKTNNVLYTYSNGVIKQTKTITISGILNSITNLFLGSYNGGEYPQYFNGQIGVVRMYNKPLTDSEVLNNFNTTKATYGL